MTHNLSKIDEYFPFEKFREGQRECIEFALNAFDDGKKFVIIEAPTGAGKSAIGLTIAKFFSNTYYLTIQKILQTQIIREFVDTDRLDDGRRFVVDLKGRANYPCTYWERNGERMIKQKAIKQKKLEQLLESPPDCNSGYCRTKGDYRCSRCFLANDNPNNNGVLTNLPSGTQHSACPYYEQVGQALNAQTCLMNFSSYLYQSTMTGRFGMRPLMIIDECFHPHTTIATDRGNIPIGKLVNQQIDCKVLSYNTQSNVLEFKPISRRLRRAKQMTYRVTAGNRVMYPTADHKIFTPQSNLAPSILNHHKKCLKDINVGDLILINSPHIQYNQEQLLLGSLLGDACVQIVKSKQNPRKSKTARVRFRHGENQKEYIDWKYQLLSEHVKTPPTTKTSKGFGKLTHYFATKYTCYETIKPVLSGNRKKINTNWLNKIDEFGLAVWFMDDGSYSSDVAHFHTERYTEAENEIIADWLRTSWHLPAIVLNYTKEISPNVRSQPYYYISIRDGGHTLPHLIAKYIPKSMRYKLPQGGWDEYDVKIENYTPIPITHTPIISIDEYKTTTTYDLEIEDNHNYFAGNSLVSNCHQLEPQLLNFVALSVNDKILQNIGFKLKKYETPEEYWVQFIENDLLDKIGTLWQEARATNNISAQDEYNRLYRKIKSFLDSIQHGDEWVCDFENNKDYRVVKLKPIFIRKQAHNLVFNNAEHVLMMSATILDPKVYSRSIGIPNNKMISHRMRNRFPAKNRPIYACNAGKFTGGKAKMPEWAPKLLAEVDRIIEKYGDHRGIIHTHNFAISNYLMEHSKHKGRLLFQKRFNTKEEMLDKHASIKNGIIVAPAMHEGLDLKDDLSRFAILCKIPWPNFMEDKQMERRVEIDRRYYVWLCALKLVQAYGRSVRSETDWADTYVIDSGLESFLTQANNMLPEWFLEAIHETQ